MTKIKTQLTSISNSIQVAEQEANKPANSVQLLAVSKTQSADIVRSAFQAGQRCFGENYLQEALVKISELTDLNIEWHFIGPIQSNKTRDIASHFDWVQSIDRLKIAQRLSNQRPSELNELNICIQVNIDNEESKSGVAPDNVLTLAKQIVQFDNLQLRGLMIIPAKTDDQTQQHQSFLRAYSLFCELKAEYPNVDTLSMGMSADMSAAIAEGSTMVRIGTAIFGQRDSVKKQ